MNWDQRYERQMLLEGIGASGQEKLRNSKVLVVGAGGLGSPVILYLAGAGVGTIGIIDNDAVETSNLHRQVVHNMERVGVNKALSAQETVNKLNDEVNVITYEAKLDENNAIDIVKEYDFVIDAVDNFRGKFLINDTCVRLGIPFCHGTIVGYHGQAMTWIPKMGPCYRCIFEEAPREGSYITSKQVGVLGPVVGVIGSLQAIEAVKYITGVGELLTGKLFTFDALTMNTRVVKFPNNRSDCKACGKFSR